MARKLIVELIADPRGYTAGLEKAAASTKLFGREVDQMTRGIASGTGVMHSFGRSLAFASGGFIAFAGVSKFLDDSVKAAIDAGVAQRSLTAQMKASGESFTASSDEIEKANLGLAKFGFTSEDAVHALTVLERGTGNIQRALSLETVSADLARAKNIDLASAATVVAKVFGGQETALRRAVPGLDKTAHGMDLVREAQQRLAGQAAAATTPGERFNATLHDTEVILGTALLPKLNTGLGYLTEWLNKINRATDKTDGFAGSVHRLAERLGELGDNAATAGHNTKSAWDQVPGVFQDALLGILGKGGGGIGAFVALTNALGGANTSLFKAVGLGSLVRQPRPAGRGLYNPFAPILKQYEETHPQPPPHDLPTSQAALPIVGRGGLTPMQRAQLALSAAGLTKTTKDDLAALVTQRQLYGKAIATETARLNQATSAGAAKKFAKNLQAWQDKDAAAMSQILSITKKGASDAGKTSAELAGQRNTWFDSRVSRMLDRVQDIPAVQGQIARLKEIAALIQQRIDATKDVTRKLNLEDTLATVQRTISGDQDQQAADAKQKRLDAAQLLVDRAGLTKTLSDDLAALKHQLGVLKAEGATQSEIVAQQAAIQSKEDEIKQAGKDRLANLRQQKLDAAALAVARADLTGNLTKELAARKHELAVLKQTGATQLEIVNQQQSINDIQQQIDEKNKQAAAKEKAAEKASAQRAADRVAAINKAALAQAKEFNARDALVVRRQRAAVVTARNARQFRALGLTATGEAPTPGTEALERRLAALRERLVGTGLDRGKLHSQLAGAARNLVEGAGQPIRAAIDQLFDSVDAKLDERSKGTLTRFKRLSATNIAKSLGPGLSGAQLRRLEAGIATIGPGLTRAQGTPAFSGAGAHAIVFNGPTHFHGVQDIQGLENELHKRTKARGHARRGTR